MEFHHFFGGDLVRAVGFHSPIQLIVEQKFVGHANAMLLHGMVLSIVVVAVVAGVVVTSSLFAYLCAAFTSTIL